MAKTYLLSLIVLISTFATRITAQTVPAGAASGLHIVIAPGKDERGRLTIHHHKYFYVLFTNRSDKTIRLWNESCQPGYDTLNFRFSEQNGNSWTMRKARFGGDWKDYRLKTISIAPGATYVWRVVPMDILQGTWVWMEMLEPNSGEEVTIVPIFEIKADAHAKERSIWTGRVEGRAVKVRVVNPNLITPHHYLWNQCPRQALKIIKPTRN